MATLFVTPRLDRSRGPSSARHCSRYRLKLSLSQFRRATRPPPSNYAQCLRKGQFEFCGNRILSQSVQKRLFNYETIASTTKLEVSNKSKSSGCKQNDECSNQRNNVQKNRFQEIINKMPASKDFSSNFLLFFHLLFIQRLNNRFSSFLSQIFVCFGFVLQERKENRGKVVNWST